MMNHVNGKICSYLFFHLISVKCGPIVFKYAACTFPLLWLIACICVHMLCVLCAVFIVRKVFIYLFLQCILYWLNSLQIKWSGMDARLSTTPFIDEIYDLLKETLSEYDVVISRWPEYIFPLESVCTANNFISFSISYIGWDLGRGLFAALVIMELWLGGCLSQYIMTDKHDLIDP